METLSKLDRYHDLVQLLDELGFIHRLNPDSKWMSMILGCGYADENSNFIVAHLLMYHLDAVRKEAHVSDDLLTWALDMFEFNINGCAAVTKVRSPMFKPRLKISLDYHGKGENVHRDVYISTTADTAYTTLASLLSELLKLEAASTEEAASKEKE